MKAVKRFACICMAAATLLASGVPARAAFTDSNQIQYSTAVGVMNGAGILSGYTDGSFRPYGTISREEAAKAVAFAVLGEAGVMELPRNETAFSDVDPRQWSAPYIKWCAENGIVGGLGDGSFYPEGKVTGYQLAKMLLCAAGYGAKGEYAGPSWEVKSAMDGFAKGIFTGITDADPSRSVTREEAALYIFNAITRIERVVYNESTGAYVPADGTEALDNTFAASVYGIVETQSQSTVFRGIVSENFASGAGATIVGGEEYSYRTGLDLLGHAAVIYTNGASGIKNRIYYIGDETETLDLKNDIYNNSSYFDSFFGEDLKISSGLLVYDSDGALLDTNTIPGFDPEGHSAPAGTYNFYNGELISYLPHFTELAVSIGPITDGTVVIGGEEYAVDNVICAGEYSEGDIMLARLMAEGTRLVLTPVNSLSGTLSKLEYLDDGRYQYTIDKYIFKQSPIEDKSFLPTNEQPVVGKSYRVYFDSNSEIFAIVRQ